MRPGCDRPAAARVAFDPVALQLWLDPLSRNSAPVQELCEFHVERLTVPRGWSATDRRPGEPTVAAPVAVVPADRSTAPSAPSAPGPEPVVHDPDPEPVVEPVVARAAPAPDPVVEPVVEPEPGPVVEPEPAATEPAADPEPVVPAAIERSPRREPPRRPPGRPPSRRPAKGAEPSLLSRAFAWTGPQESILTQGGPEAEPEQLDPSSD